MESRAGPGRAEQAGSALLDPSCGAPLGNDSVDGDHDLESLWPLPSQQQHPLHPFPELAGANTTRLAGPRFSARATNRPRARPCSARCTRDRTMASVALDASLQGSGVPVGLRTPSRTRAYPARQRHVRPPHSPRRTHRPRGKRSFVALDSARAREQRTINRRVRPKTFQWINRAGSPGP